MIWVSCWSPHSYFLSIFSIFVGGWAAKKCLETLLPLCCFSFFFPFLFFSLFSASLLFRWRISKMSITEWCLDIVGIDLWDDGKKNWKGSAASRLQRLQILIAFANFLPNKDLTDICFYSKVPFFHLLKESGPFGQSWDVECVGVLSKIGEPEKMAIMVKISSGNLHFLVLSSATDIMGPQLKRAWASGTTEDPSLLQVVFASRSEVLFWQAENKKPHSPLPLKRESSCRKIPGQTFW